MPILHRTKTLMMWVELLSYKRKPWELWIISLETHSSPLIKFNHILKLEDNILFINKSLSNLLPPSFKNWFTFCSYVHNYQTVSSTSDKIFKPSNRTDSFGKKSITIGAINSWNKTQYQFCHLLLKTCSPSKIKCLLSKKCIENY